MIKALFLALPRVLFGLLFLAASLDKIYNQQAFAQIVANYQLLPPELVGVVAAILPWLEAVVGIALVTGAFRRGAALLAECMMLGFMGALAYNLNRGLDVACGCFTTDVSASAHMGDAMTRDAIFAIWGAIVIILAFLEDRKPPKAQPQPQKA